MEPRYTTAQNFFATIQPNDNASRTRTDNRAENLFRRGLLIGQISFARSTCQVV